MGKACAESLVPHSQYPCRACPICGHRLCFSLIGMLQQAGISRDSGGRGDNSTVTPSPLNPILMDYASQLPLCAIPPTYAGYHERCRGDSSTTVCLLAK